MNQIKPDDGYFFGIGVFETIGIRQGYPVFLKEHLKRMSRGMEFLHIRNAEGRRLLTEEKILERIRQENVKEGALKITVSEENAEMTFRANPYGKEQYLKGFSLDMARSVRNETSPFTYVKSLNYGDNILEKRAAARRGIDEPVFVNMKGQLAEGAVTNLFFGKNGKLFTPPVSCGLLDGTVRRYLLERYDAEEKIIYPEEIQEYDEMMVTNSLLMAMPVCRFKTVSFSSRRLCKMIWTDYEKYSQKGHFLL